MARYAEEMGYDVTTMGDVIRDIAKEKGLEPTPNNLDLIAEGIRKDGGDAAVAERCIESMRMEEATRVMVDGIRSLEEVEVFRTAFNDTILLATHASPRTRFHRLKARGRSDDPRDWEAFYHRDKRELGFGVGSAIAMVDYMLVNEGTLKDFKRNFDKLMERLNEL